MATPLVEVRAMPGRVAFSDPSGKVRIPNDRYIRLPLTSWISHLAHRHGDVEIRPLPAPKRAAAPDSGESRKPRREPSSGETPKTD